MAAQRGFTYVGLLLAVALAGVALAAAGTLWSTTAKRDKELELLFVGDQYRRAIGSYYEGTPGAKRYPQRLEDLLEDKRLAVTRRHSAPGLRRPDDRPARLGAGAPARRRDRRRAQPLGREADEGRELRAERRVVRERRVLPRLGVRVRAAGRRRQAGRAGDPGRDLALHDGARFRRAARGAPPPRRQRAVPRDPAVCGAARAGDLRDCSRAGFTDETLLEECRQVAARRYRACLAGGAAE